MAKGDKYYLIDQNGYTKAMFELTDDRMSGNCYTCYSWSTDKEPIDYHFFADIFCKWDSCTHWWFRGEDYDVESDTEHDSYYHICGSLCFIEHIQIMCFLWKVAVIELNKRYERETSETGKTYLNTEREYFNNEKIKKLVEFMIDGCEIKEEPAT